MRQIAPVMSRISAIEQNRERLFALAYAELRHHADAQDVLDELATLRAEKADVKEQLTQLSASLGPKQGDMQGPLAG